MCIRVLKLQVWVPSTELCLQKYTGHRAANTHKDIVPSAHGYSLLPRTSRWAPASATLAGGGNGLHISLIAFKKQFHTMYVSVDPVESTIVASLYSGMSVRYPATLQGVPLRPDEVSSAFQAMQACAHAVAVCVM